MAYAPMNRTRALIICTRPQDYAPARLRLATRHLLDRPDTTEEEQRLASDAIEWLRSKRHGEAQLKTAESSNSDQSPRTSGRPAAGAGKANEEKKELAAALQRD